MSCRQRRGVPGSYKQLVSPVTYSRYLRVVASVLPASGTPELLLFCIFSVKVASCRVSRRDVCLPFLLRPVA